MTRSGAARRDAAPRSLWTNFDWIEATHRNKFLGTPASDKRIRLKHADFWRVIDGKIVENRVLLDASDVMRQVSGDPSVPDNGREDRRQRLSGNGSDRLSSGGIRRPPRRLLANFQNMSLRSYGAGSLWTRGSARRDVKRVERGPAMRAR